MNAVYTGANPSSTRDTVLASAFMSSFLLDFLVRISVSTNLSPAVVERLPIAKEQDELTNRLVELFLRLNCLTEAYALLWEEIMGTPWTSDAPLRNAWDRKIAQIEIDTIVAHSLGITADELCMIYRTQFPVMRRYDEEDRFDANGRLVPKEVLKADAKLKDGQELSEADRTWVHPQSDVTYVLEYPFSQLDREASLKEAYERLGQHGS